MDPVKLSDLVDADSILKRQRISKDLGVWEASSEFYLCCFLQTFFYLGIAIFAGVNMCPAELPV